MSAEPCWFVQHPRHCYITQQTLHKRGRVSVVSSFSTSFNPCFPVCFDVFGLVWLPLGSFHLPLALWDIQGTTPTAQSLFRASAGSCLHLKGRTLTHPVRDAAFPIFLFLLRGIFPKQLLHLLLGGSQRIWSISLPLIPGKGMALPAHSPFPAALASKGSVVFLSYVTCVHACSQTETSLAFPSWPSRHLEHAWAYVEYVGICGHFWFCSRGHPCWLCIVVHQVQEEKNLLATTSRPLLPFFVCLFVCVPIQ